MHIKTRVSNSGVVGYDTVQRRLDGHDDVALERSFGRDDVEGVALGEGRLLRRLGHIHHCGWCERGGDGGGRRKVVLADRHL